MEPSDSRHLDGTFTQNATSIEFKRVAGNTFYTCFYTNTHFTELQSDRQYLHIDF